MQIGTYFEPMERFCKTLCEIGTLMPRLSRYIHNYTVALVVIIIVVQNLKAA